MYSTLAFVTAFDRKVPLAARMSGGVFTDACTTQLGMLFASTNSVLALDLRIWLTGLVAGINKLREAPRSARHVPP